MITDRALERLTRMRRYRPVGSDASGERALAELAPDLHVAHGEAVIGVYVHKSRAAPVRIAVTNLGLHILQAGAWSFVAYADIKESDFAPHREAANSLYIRTREGAELRVALPSRRGRSWGDAGQLRSFLRQVWRDSQESLLMQLAAPDFRRALGEPDIELTGSPVHPRRDDQQPTILRLWVHGREFPLADDFCDANWLEVTVQCAGEGANVWATGPMLHLSELQKWAASCEQLQAAGEGKADLPTIEPQLEVHLSRERDGALLAEARLTPHLPSQEHQFKFTCSEDQLTTLIQMCANILRAYPIKSPRV